MNAIKLYSRYTDNKNRLFTVIERFGSMDEETVSPGQLKILNVHAESVTIIEHNEFLGYLTSGSLKQL